MEDQLIGRTLGPYRVVEAIGHGGMSTVYRAHHATLDRMVAVKVLPATFAHDAEFAERFRREALAIAQLQHPNILPIYDFGQEGDIAYLVMQLVPGGTLQDRCGMPLPLDWSIGVVAQVARALDHAHARGIVHRDVKPANVLLADGDWAMLADFGIAKMLGGSAAGLTRTGMGVGTPAYISPEQANGVAVDGRSDIYSLAMMLFEMLTGSVAFTGDTPVGVIMKHVNEPVPSLRVFRGDIPAEVDDVVQRGLAKRPDDRFQTAGQFATALEAASSSARQLGGANMSARRTVRVSARPSVARGRGWQDRAPLLGAIAAIACVILVAAAALVMSRVGGSAHGAEASTDAFSSATAVAAAQTATERAIVADATATSLAEVAAEATSKARETATAVAEEAQGAALQATVEAAVQAAIAALPTPTTPPQPTPPAPTPPTPFPPAAPAGAGRLVLRILHSDCTGVSGVVTVSDRPVGGYILNGSITVTGETKSLAENMHVPGPEFRLEFPARPPRGTYEMRLLATKPGNPPSIPVRASATC